MHEVGLDELAERHKVLIDWAKRFRKLLKEKKLCKLKEVV